MRPLNKLFLALSLFSSMTAISVAQRPGGQGGPGGGPNRAAFEQFRNQHKFTFQLQAMMTAGMMELDRQKSTQLRPDQAKKLLAVIAPLRKQPKLTQAQAKSSIQKVQRILDARQLATVNQVLQRRQGGPGGMRGPGGGPGGRPGGRGPGGGGPGMRGPGGGGPGGNRPRFDMARMQNFNPLYPNPQSPRYQMEKQRTDRFMGYLQARAAGKMVKMQMPPRPNGQRSAR